MDTTSLFALGSRVGDLLTERGETVAVAEGSCGGLVSAALLARPGASAYYRGGAVIYTPDATRAFVAGTIETPPGLRGASEPFVEYLAESVARRLDTTWGIGEGGATGPSGNPYGDPAGHVWTAVCRLRGSEDDEPVLTTRHHLTGDDDRGRNMVAFATVALELLHDRIR